MLIYKNARLVNNKTSTPITAGASPLPTAYYFLCNSGFGLLPDLAQWTSTHYACTRFERQKSKKNKRWLSHKQPFDNCFFHKYMI